MNASSVLEFVALLDALRTKHPGKKLVYCAQPGRRSLTNAAFLLGSYAILALDKDPDAVWTLFSAAPQGTFEHYRDATFSAPRFDLTLLDCWRALANGKSLGWIDRPKAGEFLCGKIDKDEYDHYDQPFNGDLHTVVPGKFVAFRGPIELAGGAEYRDHNGYRDFSPQYYVECFKEMGVTTVIRLNEPHYDREAFEAHGIRHVDLEFDDCTAPPDGIVGRFFRAVDAAQGLVAVHCKAGLGRTGTLIALYLMRRYRFTAREAMGWLRIMRPGSVIGDQQEYLCAVEEDVRAAFLRRASTPGVSPAVSPSLSPSHSPPSLSPPSLSPSPSPSRTPSSTAEGLPVLRGRTRSADESAELAREVEAAMRRRGAARGAAALGGAIRVGSGGC